MEELELFLLNPLRRSFKAPTYPRSVYYCSTLRSKGKIHKILYNLEVLPGDRRKRESKTDIKAQVIGSENFNL